MMSFCDIGSTIFFSAARISAAKADLGEGCLGLYLPRTDRL